MANASLYHLDQILGEFRLSGKQLAEYLNVDYSLVSKWRNGKRRLNSEYIEKLTRLFLDLDAKYGYNRIGKVLNKMLTEEEKQNDAYIYSLLKFWLSSTSPDTKEHAAERFIPHNVQKQFYYIFQGSQGRRDAINTFLDCVISNQGLNLWLFSQEDNKWFSEDENFLKEWQDKNFQVLKNRNTIHVIHPVERRFKQIAQSMYWWIPMHLKGNALAYYLPKYWDPEIKITIFLAENQLVLFGVTSEKFTKKNMTYLFTNSEVLKNAKDVLTEIFRQSTRMFEQYALESNGRFFSAFHRIVENGNPVYYFSGAPILFMVPQDCLIEALSDNSFAEEDKKAYTEILFQFSFECMQNVPYLPITYVIQVKQLEALLKLDRVMMRFLSHCIGKPFYVSQKMFRKLLLHSLEALFSVDNFTILLTDQSMFYSYENIALFVKEKEVAGFIGTDYETEVGARALTTQEDSVVSSIYYSCQAFVESHRMEHMDKENVRAKILAMMEQA